MKSLIYLTLFFSSLQISTALASKDEKGIYSFMLENDIFASTDKHYTNGVRFSYLSPETSVNEYVEDIANKFLFFKTCAKKRYSYAFGQSMFTPKNIKVSTPNPKDRPYAGWTYLSWGIISANDKRLDNFEISLGIVGKASLADKTQKFVHKHVGSPRPMGWNHQLKTEPGLIVSYDRQWRNKFELNIKDYSVDITPSAGTNLGNIYTDISAGLMTRFGKNIPFDYGAPRIRPSQPGSDFFIPCDDLGWYLFAGSEMKIVARNIFLDGNSFRKSPSVHKRNIVFDMQMGAVFIYKEMRVGYTHVVRSKEFKFQKASDQFGAISLSFRL